MFDNHLPSDQRSKNQYDMTVCVLVTILMLVVCATIGYRMGGF